MKAIAKFFLHLKQKRTRLYWKKGIKIHLDEQEIPRVCTHILFPI